MSLAMLLYANVDMLGLNMLRVWVRQDLRRGRRYSLTRRERLWARRWGMLP